MKKVILIILCLCSVLFAQDKPYTVINSFGGGELSPLLNAREDLSKFHSGLSLMENMIPLPQGAAQKRPGTKYVAGSKSNTKIRLLPFEYSTEKSFIMELGNQYARFFTDNAAVLSGSGTEDVSSLNNVIAHWLMNDNAANTVVIDDDGATHNGILTGGNSRDVHTEGQVGTGAFDLASFYTFHTADHADFTFVEGTDGNFSITIWAYITETGTEQVLVSKWQEEIGNEHREWKLLIDESRKLKMCIADESLLLDSDLIAHWKLNDSAATSTVVDAIGSNNGTMDDGADDYTSDHSVAGKVDNSFDFDGTNDVITVSDDAVFTFGDASDDSPFSISAWINMDDATGFTILSKSQLVDVCEWLFWVDLSDKLMLRLFDNSRVNYISRKYNTAITAQQGSWIHVVATYDATEATSGITLYINGVAVDDADENSGSYTAMHNLTSDVYIGEADCVDNLTEHNNQYANGKIDNVMIFGKELSQAEVTALYNGADGIEELETVYPFAITDDALTFGWRFITMTYEGEHGSWTGATAANYIILYIDETAVDVTATQLSTYSKMQDTDSLLRVGYQLSSAGAREKMWSDKIDEAAIFGDVLTSTEVDSLFATANTYEIDTPYLTADIFEIKYIQSADVLYLTHPDYETRKLSRYANDDWRLSVLNIENGPFRDQNTDVADFIAASATTGSITLTATGCAPFISSATAGHLPSGTAATSKSQTGALFKLVQTLATGAYEEILSDNYTDSQVEDVSWLHCGTIAKGVTWYLTTLGTWTGTLEVQRNYTIGAAHGAATWETVFTFQSTDDRNVSTNAEETIDAADYRVILTATGDAAEPCQVYFRISDTDHIGIVEITSVTSPTVALGTVVKTLADTSATHRWSEGAWSNYRGWPRTVTFFEDRLTFGGNANQPDTIWASVTADYENMTAGADDDDALIFTLSSRQVNVIEWIIGKNKLLIGTSGAEWTLEGSNDEPLTPSNVKAEQHSTYGSANLQATLASESVLFFQRGAEKMRELAYNWESDSYVAPDMTILVPEITGDGITDVAYQQTPNSILWCVREDGEMPIFVYERKELITSWARLITDGLFESVAVISGSAEDQVWVSVKRTMAGVNQGTAVRYIEYFSARDFGTDPCDAYFVDSGITYDSDATTTITGLTHLEAEAVAVLADGAIQSNKTVSGSGEITITSAATAQVGLPFTVKLKTMPLSFLGAGSSILSRVKRVSGLTIEYYNSGDFDYGVSETNKYAISVDGMDSDITPRKTFPAGFGKRGQVFLYQLSPESFTIISLGLDFQVF